MENYNYQEELKSDVIEFIKDNYSPEEWGNLEYDEVFNRCVEADSVTGFASGSRFCNYYKAEECLCHNLDLVMAVINDVSELCSPETIDMKIRLELLPEAVKEAINEIGGAD